MARAVDGTDLFRGDGDRRYYLGLLQRVVERQKWRVLTFALMRTHVHLLAVATNKQLSDGLWWMPWRYAERFKAAYSPHFGHVFGGRPKTKPIADDSYFLAVVRYIARNPIGVSCERPEEYSWSAHRALVGASAPPPFLAREELLAWFGSERRYQGFVIGKDPEGHADVARWEAVAPDARPDLKEVIAELCPASMHAANKQWGYSIRAISRATGMSYGTVQDAIARRSRGLAP